jgi:hypothetical protein
MDPLNLTEGQQAEYDERTLKIKIKAEEKKKLV